MSDGLNWNDDGADWPNRAASRFYLAGGLHWHVQRMGCGPVLLLLHGTGSSTHSWRDLLPLLASRFDCVAIDLPGHGFTSSPSLSGLSLPGIADSVHALLGTLELQPAFVIGHSAGAAIAAQLSLSGHIEATSIVSLNGALMPLSGLPGLFFPPAAKVMAASATLSRLMAWHVSGSGAVERLIRGTGSVIDQRGVELYARLARSPAHLHATLGMMSRWNLVPLFRRLPALECDMHLVVGSRDLAVPAAHARAVRSQVPRGSVNVLHDKGHLAHEEAPSLVAQLVFDLITVDQHHHAELAA